jgi:alkylation response protein AidB-like acyl-CoA dehydrogenase
MNFDLTPDQGSLQARVREFAEAEIAGERATSPCALAGVHRPKR